LLVRRLSFSSPFLKSAVAATGVAVIALATFLPTQASASPQGSDAAKKHATINTFKDYDQAVGSLGCPNSTTYGETITVPAKQTKLTHFKYYMGGQAAAGQSMVVRGEVYAWDGDKAMGSSLYESAPQSFPKGSAFHKVTYNTGGVAVTPGQKYLIFATLDKDYDQCQGTLGERMAAVSGDTYRRGDARYLSSSGDESQWTTQDWPLEPHGYDLAMKVYLR
jgi:hypothetical protein